MTVMDQYNITDAVLATQAAAPDARLKFVMDSLVRHLHDFARETALTDDEWLAGIRFLTDAGHLTDDKRQEFILLSDVLGLSMLVTAQNHAKASGCTEPTVFGPFHVEGSPLVPLGADIANGAPGAPCFVSGHVRALDGTPVAGATLEVWQADEDGHYDVQIAGLDEHRARGTLRSGPQGEYAFRSILAHSYAIPHDGPVGRMLGRLGRHPWRPAHLHFRITAPGFKTLVTHVFRRGDPWLDSDAVFGVRPTLVADWVEQEPGAAPDGTRLDEPWYTLAYDFVLDPVAAA